MLASTVLAVLVAAGCSSSGSSSSTPPTAGTSSSSGQAASGQRVTLTFWTWVPNMDKIVAIWNKANLDIQVAGADPVRRRRELTVAYIGREGSRTRQHPLRQVEYQVLPTLVSSNYLANIAQYDGSLKSDFPAGNWNQVTLGSNSLYGVPQDAAPMALFYRADLLRSTA